MFGFDAVTHILCNDVESVALFDQRCRHGFEAVGSD